ncbi:MAG: PH domain-containing protein [Chloroflexota bacterium]
MMSNHTPTHTEVIPDFVEPHLLPGETVIWKAKPERALFLRKYGAISGWGMGMIGIMAFWFIVSVILAGSLGPVIHNMVFFWAVPSIIVGGLLIYGPLVVAAREWSNTDYVLTDRRLILRRGVVSPTLSVIHLSEIPRMEVEVKQGWGHVLLLGGTALERLGQNGRLEYHPAHIKLRDLSEPDTVRERIITARAALA